MLEIWDNINSSSLTHVSWARKEDAWSMALKTYLFIIYWYEISLSTKQVFCGCAKLLDKFAVKMSLCYKIGRNQNLDESVFMINTWSSISNPCFITIFCSYFGKYVNVFRILYCIAYRNRNGHVIWINIIETSPLFSKHEINRQKTLTSGYKVHKRINNVDLRSLWDIHLRKYVPLNIPQTLSFHHSIISWY